MRCFGPFFGADLSGWLASRGLRGLIGRTQVQPQMLRKPYTVERLTHRLWRAPSAVFNSRCRVRYRVVAIPSWSRRARPLDSVRFEGEAILGLILSTEGQRRPCLSTAALALQSPTT